LKMVQHTAILTMADQ